MREDEMVCHLTVSETPGDGKRQEAWRAAVHGVAKNQT